MNNLSDILHQINHKIFILLEGAAAILIYQPLATALGPVDLENLPEFFIWVNGVLFLMLTLIIYQFGSFFRPTQKPGAEKTPVRLEICYWLSVIGGVVLLLRNIYINETLVLHADCRINGEPEGHLIEFFGWFLPLVGLVHIHDNYKLSSGSYRTLNILPFVQFIFMTGSTSLAMLYVSITKEAVSLGCFLTALTISSLMANQLCVIVEMVTLPLPRWVSKTWEFGAKQSTESTPPKPLQYACQILSFVGTSKSLIWVLSTTSGQFQNSFFGFQTSCVLLSVHLLLWLSVAYYWFKATLILRTATSEVVKDYLVVPSESLMLFRIYLLPLLKLFLKSWGLYSNVLGGVSQVQSFFFTLLHPCFAWDSLKKEEIFQKKTQLDFDGTFMIASKVESGFKLGALFLTTATVFSGLFDSTIKLLNAKKLSKALENAPVELTELGKVKNIGPETREAANTFANHALEFKTKQGLVDETPLGAQANLSAGVFVQAYLKESATSSPELTEMARSAIRQRGPNVSIGAMDLVRALLDQDK